MDADPTATCLDVMLQGGLLLGVGEDVAGGVQKDDDLVLREIHVVKQRGIFGSVHREIIGGSEHLDSLDAVSDGGVAVAGGGGEDERFEPGGMGWKCVGQTKSTRQKQQP